MSAKIRCFIDGEEKVLTEGLKVRDLLAPGDVQAVLRGEKMVVDGFGNERGLGGAITQGLCLTLKPRERAPKPQP